MTMEPEQTIGEQLGLGKRWQPTNSGWRWVKVTPPGQPDAYVFILETPLGQVGVLFDTDALRNLANQAMERATGLVVPKIVPQANGRYTPPKQT